jgi:hypothetical protein
MHKEFVHFGIAKRDTPTKGTTLLWGPAVSTLTFRAHWRIGNCRDEESMYFGI